MYGLLIDDRMLYERHAAQIKIINLLYLLRNVLIYLILKILVLNNLKFLS